MNPQGREAAALALHRFGFGPAAGSIAAIADDPRGAVLADLERPGAGRVAADLPTSGTAARAVFEFQAERQAEQKLASRAQKAAETGSEAMAMPAKAAVAGRRNAAAAAASAATAHSERGPGAFRRSRQCQDSVLSSVLFGSGPIISASRPTRLSPWPALTSAKRFARTCWAASPTCCRRSKAIRRCCSISTTSNPWARIRLPA